MINELKASNVALGFVRNSNGAPRESSQKSNDQLSREIGATNKMYSYVQQRGYSSNVMPVNRPGQAQRGASPGQSGPQSINKSTFQWNTFKAM